jgi:hypothetical protein
MINFIYKYIRTIKKNKEGAGGGENEKNFSRKFIFEYGGIKDMKSF